MKKSPTWVDIAMWVLASLSAGVGGTFTLMAYTHSEFVSASQFEDHKDGTHGNALTRQEFDRGIKPILDQLDKLDNKLDQFKNKE